MEREDALDLIRSFALAEFRETLADHLSPSVRITVLDDGDDRNGSQNLSYFGGHPCLPANTPWPEWDKKAYLEAAIASIRKRLDKYTERTKDQPESDPGFRERRLTGFRNSIAKKSEELAIGQIPLAFLGQFSLREIHAVAALPGWPREGVLAFFYDTADQPWGFDPLDRGHCRILYCPEDASLLPSDFPRHLSDGSRFPKHSLQFAREWTLPPRLELNNGGLALWKTNEYQELLQRLNSAARKSKRLISRVAGPFCSVADVWALISGRSSSPGEFHPEALTEPYVNLSIHTALHSDNLSLARTDGLWKKRLLLVAQLAHTFRRAMSSSSLHADYRRFVTTTG